MRWWSGPGGPGSLDVTVTPTRVQFLGGSGNAIRNVDVGRNFDLSGAVPRLGADVPRWMGETIGFWDGTALITWTSNIQGWFTHSSWEYSSKLQTVEIWTPRLGCAGQASRARARDGVLRRGRLGTTDPQRAILGATGRLERRAAQQSDALQSDDFLVNGRATPVVPGTTFNIASRTSTVGPGPPSGKSTSSRRCSGRRARTFSTSKKSRRERGHPRAAYCARASRDRSRAAAAQLREARGRLVVDFDRRAATMAVSLAEGGIDGRVCGELQICRTDLNYSKSWADGYDHPMPSDRGRRAPARRHKGLNENPQARTNRAPRPAVRSRKNRNPEDEDEA